MLASTNANYFYYSKLIRKSIARVLTVYNQTQKVHFAATHVCLFPAFFFLSVFAPIVERTVHAFGRGSHVALSVLP